MNRKRLAIALAVFCGTHLLLGGVSWEEGRTDRESHFAPLQLDLSNGPSRPLQTKEYLVWDPDHTPTSGPVIDLTLLNDGYRGDYTTDILPYLDHLSDYSSIWICLGVMPNNYVLEDTFGTHKDSLVVDSLVSYLVYHHGKIYLEGGDTWAWDKPTLLHPYFSIVGQLDGSSIDGVLGRVTTFTEGMDFDYTGENNVLDDIAQTGTSMLVFVDRGASSHGIGVAYDDGAGLYKTVGSSFEFGGLADGSEPTSKTTLADSIMHFFGLYPPPPPNWDVGVSSILSPDTPYVEPWAGLSPAATVKNWGLNSATFEAWCEVDSEGTTLYQASQTVGPLLPDSSQQVTFPLWSPDGPGNYYNLEFYTQLFGDQNPLNDTARIEVTTSKLFGTIVDSTRLSGLPANTLAGITFCDSDSHFYLVSTVEKYVYRLDPRTWAYEQAFPTTNPGSENPWGICWDGRYFWVEHHDFAFSYFYDRQYEQTGSPTGYYCEADSLIGGRAAGMDFDRRYVRQTKWSGENGIYRLDLPECTPVSFITGPWSSSSQTGCSYIPYTHELLTGGDVSNYLYKVDAEDGSQLQAAPMPDLADVDIEDVGIAGADTLYACVTTTRPENTIYKVAIELRRLGHDFAALSIEIPGDTVIGESSLLARVANWGRADESNVWVYSSATVADSLNPEFRDSTQVSLARGEELEVAFPDTWVVQQPGVLYELLVETRLVGDENTYNDEVMKKVHGIAFSHDCGVDSILSPPDTVEPDSLYVPRAWVKNYGNVEETFEVVCTIDGYQDTVSIVGLLPGSPMPCTFSVWTVPPPDSATYLMTVQSSLVGDNNRSNDTLTKSISALRVGVLENINFQFPISNFQLQQNRPNPFTHSTTIRYSLPSADGGQRTAVNLSVYDLSGRLVKSLVDEAQSPGRYSAAWDGKDQSGRAVGSGVYFYRLLTKAEEVGETVAVTKKLVVLR